LINRSLLPAIEKERMNQKPLAGGNIMLSCVTWYSGKPRLRAFLLGSKMRRIPLGNSDKYTLVDDMDYEELNKYYWYASYGKKLRYVKRHVKNTSEKWTSEFMHRHIMNTPNCMKTDHINGDGFDNRRINLRICTHSDNLQNQHTKRGTSQYQGVGWFTRKNKWHAYIQRNNKLIHLGYFRSEKMAAIAYNIAALRYYGIGAKLNEI